MARVVRSLISLILIFALSAIASPSFAKPNSRVRATSFIPVQTTVGELTDQQLEQALVSEIHRVANKAFAEIKAKDPSVRITQLKKVERAVVQKLKATGQLIALARSLNPKIYVSVVATEVLVTAFGFGLIATGNVAAASAVISFPSAPLVLSALVTYEAMKIRWKVARELNVSARELESLRKQVIGYNAKNKITSLLLQDGEIQRELELVAKFVKVGANAPQVITLKEIERIIGETADGKSFLSHAANERGNKEVYATLLLQYLNDSPESIPKVLEQIVLPSESRQSKMQLILDKLSISQPKIALDFPELRKHLLDVADIQKHVDRELKTARKEISLTKKKVKSGDLTKEQGLEARAHLKSELVRLHEVQIQTYRHQYTLLMGVKAAIEADSKGEVAKVVSSYQTDLAELRVLGSYARIQAHAKQISLPAEFRAESKPTVSIRSCQQVFARAN